MEQFERPADTFMELVKPHLLAPQQPPTVLAERQPVPRLSYLGFLQYIVGTPSGPVWYEVVLGNPYRTGDLNDLQMRTRATLAYELGNTAHMFIAPRQDDPAQEALARLVVMTAADRRMTYRWLLECDIRAAEKGSAEWTRLLLERELWTNLDLKEISAKLDAGLEWPLNTLMREPMACWKWVRRVQPNRPLPTTSSWRDMKYVSVHRLLWPIARPDDPFTLGMRPVRDTQLCQTKMCVNPRHFIDPARRVKLSYDGPGKGYAGAARSPSHIRWNIENIHVLDDGRRELRCPNCETPAAPQLQDAVNWPEGIAPTTGKMYCKRCYQIYKLHLRMFTQTNTTRMPDEQRMETQSERGLRDFEEQQRQQDRQSRGLRFDWDNDWSDGTSTRDEPADPA